MENALTPPDELERPAGALKAGQVDLARPPSSLQQSAPAGRVVTFDADQALTQPAQALQPIQLRRRGRPRKSLTPVVLETDQISADDIAWLRAWAMGVPVAQAGRYYASDEIGADGRSARGYLHRLLARLRRGAGELRERELAIPYVEEFLQPLPPVAPERAASVPAAQRARPIPTLEEFARGFDADMYSEAELVELFQDEYGVSASEAATASPAPPTSMTPSAKSARQTAIERKLVILDWLGPRVTVQPSPASPLSAWIGAKLAQAIGAHLRVGTLAELALWINAQGRWWYEQVPGLGRGRAERLVSWLAERSHATGVEIDARVMKTLKVLQGQDRRVAISSATADRALITVKGDAGKGAALVPLEQLAWPVDLLGHEGLFRARTPNTLGARNDRDAVAAWLKKHLQGKSEATKLVYRRAIERLVLWALLERGCALSSLTSEDLGELREFLYQPPAHWCGDERVLKFSQDWRPLRGALSETAVRQVLGVVKNMFHAWHASGYLFADSADGVGWRSSGKREALASSSACDQPCVAPPAQPAASGTVTLDVNRSFLKEDLEAMRRTLEEMQDGPARRRLRAILLLLLTTGMRRGECERLSFGMIEPVREDNQLTGAMKIRVLGKGRKLREVPLKDVTLAALEAHYKDRIELAAAGRLPRRLLEIAKEQAPLLSVLREVRASGAAGQGDSTAAAARRVNFDARLTGGAIYSILKDFFARVAKRSGLMHGQAAFERASTHWMRHTFAHVGLAEGGDKSLATVQALLGHSSIATTGLYLKAQMGDRVRMIEAIEAVF